MRAPQFFKTQDLAKLNDQLANLFNQKLADILNPILLYGTQLLQGVPFAAPTSANDLQLLQYSATLKRFVYTGFPTPTPVPLASSTVIGITKLSVAPASPTNPLAVGDNDPRVQPTAVTAGTYGDSTHVAQVAIGADGRATGASNVAIAFPGFSSTGQGTPWSAAAGAPVRWTRQYAGIRSNAPGGSWTSGSGPVTQIGAACLAGGGAGFTDGSSLDPLRVLTIFATDASANDNCHVGQSAGNSANSTAPQFGWGPILEGCTQLITTTNVRVFAGMIKSADGVTLIGSGDSSSTVAYAMLRFSTNASDTKWMFCTGDGSGHHEVASGVTAASGSTITWSIDCSQAGSVIFTINGVSTTVTTNVPGSTKVAAAFVGVATLTNSIAQCAFGDWDQKVNP